MLLQDGFPAQGRDGSARSLQVKPRVGERRDPRPAPPVIPPVPRRTYPPITIVRPSAGQILVEAVMVLGRTMLTVLVGLAVLVGGAMGIAMAVTSILKAVGIDLSDSY